jgi:hypothetical protein
VPRAYRGFLIEFLGCCVLVTAALSGPALSQASDAQRNTVMRMRQRLIEIYQADTAKCQADDQAACDEAKSIYASLRDIDAQLIEMG